MRLHLALASILTAAALAGQDDVEPWWSLRPLAAPAVPDAGAGWSRNPIDAFIAARLRDVGLTPSPETDRRTLIRRLTFDLHGLPPTPQEIDAFVQDPNPDAYQRLVERLLASPRYGERWARHWLDAVHYGDTHGYDKDKPRPHAWPYRDYVVRALNRDKGYARFVEEQLAGDVLYPDHPDGVVATGFVAAGPWDFVGHVELGEGTLQKAVTRSLDRDDMVATAMSTFAATSVHCARCHNHKRDPIPQADYYRLQAVFAGVDRADRSYVEPAWQQRSDELAQRAAEVEQRATAFSEQLEALAAPLGPVPATPPIPTGEVATPGLGFHGAIAARDDAVQWVQVDLGAVRQLDAVVLLPAHEVYGGHDGPGFGFPRRFAVDLGDDPELATAQRIADHTAADYPHPGDDPVVLPADGVRGRYVRVTATRLWQRTDDWIFALAELLAFSDGVEVARGQPVAAHNSIEAAPRWARANLTDGFGSQRQLGADDALCAWLHHAAAAAAQRTRREHRLEQALTPALRAQRFQLALDQAALARAREELGEPPRVYAAAPTAPRPIHVLRRGDAGAPGAEVTAGALSCLPQLAHHFDNLDGDAEGARRAALARWVTDRDHPLTWRVMVNRVWLHHFGRGLVDTPNDFGRFGNAPSHPRLLDWLAVRFRDGGGSCKDLHRLIVSSATYRQESRARSDAAAVDRDNRWLWRMPRRRLEAEAIRDAVLMVSGTLDLTMGGPGARHFAFEDDHSPRYDYRGFDPDAPPSYRRSIYRFVVRSVPDPLFEVLDCADPSQLTPQRHATTTPLQALALLDNPFLVRQAEHFAQRVRGLAASPEAQIDIAYRLALGRLPEPAERAALLPYVARHGLENLCRALFNLNEFVFVD